MGEGVGVLNARSLKGLITIDDVLQNLVQRVPCPLPEGISLPAAHPAHASPPLKTHPCAAGHSRTVAHREVRTRPRPSAPAGLRRGRGLCARRRSRGARSGQGHAVAGTCAGGEGSRRMLWGRRSCAGDRKEVGKGRRRDGGRRAGGGEGRRGRAEGRAWRLGERKGSTSGGEEGRACGGLDERDLAR